VDTVSARPKSPGSNRGWLPALASSAIAVVALDLLATLSHLEDSFWSWGIAALVYFAIAVPRDSAAMVVQ